MAEKLEIRIIGREVVKPSVPTPSHLSRFNLSFLDQYTDDRFVPFSWFYSGNGSNQFRRKCEELKSSLAQTLSLFYPMAGRIRDANGRWVDCCDEGVEFVEAELNCPMSRILGSTDPDVLRLLVPVDPSPFMIWNRKTNDDQFLCVFQATLFECGGVAVTVCLTHKLADGATISAFAKAWGRIETRSGPVEPPSTTGLAPILPPLPELAGKPSTASNLSSGSGLVTRRFVFPVLKTEELKARASSSTAAGRSPTRLEAVMGLVWKCAVAASRSAKPSSTKGRVSAACVAVDLRKRLATSTGLVSESTIGNLVGAAFATAEIHHSGDDNVSDLVVALSKALDAVNERLRGIGTSSSSAMEIISSVLFEVSARKVFMSGPVDLDSSYMFTSMCGSLPINLDLGLGSGPAIWVTPILANKNMVMLMDAEERPGVQALVTLGEQEMEFFQNDKCLLSFAIPATTPSYKPKYASLL